MTVLRTREDCSVYFTIHVSPDRLPMKQEMAQLTLLDLVYRQASFGAAVRHSYLPRQGTGVPPLLGTLRGVK